MVYFWGTFSMCIFGFLYDHLCVYTNADLIKKQCVWILYTLPLLFIAMFRYDVGTDYLSIYWNFYRAVSVGRKSVFMSEVELDKGLYYFNKILLCISSEPLIFFIFSSLIIYLITFVYIKKMNNKITLPTLIFFVSGLYFASLNVIRQFMALAIVVLFFDFIKDKHIWKYTLVCCLAMSFHLSAIVLFILYPLYRININRRKFVQLLVVSILAIPFLSIVARKIIEHTRYNYYLKSHLYVIDADMSGVIYACIITTFVWIFFKRIFINDDGNIWKWVLLIYDVLVISSFVIPLCNRMAIYFKYFVFLGLLPYMFEKIRNKRLKFLVEVTSVAFLTCAMIYLYYYRGISDVFPYQSIG